MFTKPKLWIALAVVAVITLALLIACGAMAASDGSELVGAASDIQLSPVLAPCRYPFEDPPSAQCEEYFTNAFENGDEDVFFDLRACYNGWMPASQDAYCQYLMDKADAYALSVEACSTELRQKPPNDVCEMWIEVSFKAGEETLIGDLIGCMNGTLDSSSTYCMALGGLADQNFVWTEACRDRAGQAPPHYACDTYISLLLEMLDDEILADWQACLDGGLDSTSAYCQYLFKVAEELDME